MSEPNIIVQSEAHPRLDSNAYTLTVRQQPERAKVFNGVQQKEKGRSHGPGAPKPTIGAADANSDRKPVDPPPIIQLQIIDPVDPAQNYLQSPYFFMCCSLADEDAQDLGSLTEAKVPDDPHSSNDGNLSGMLVSSLHRLKDTNNTDGGFFVFPDISVRLEGTFRLRFSLFEMVKDARPHVLFVKAVLTDPFQVHNQRNFPGMLESTYLSRSFSDQGVRLRVRKEPRILGKRPAQSSEMPNRPSQESSSRSASRQESSGLQSPLEQTGNFPSGYGETFPSQGITPQYQSYSGYPHRDTAADSRSPFPPHDYQHFLGYQQGFSPSQDRYSQGAGTFSGQEMRTWPESYTQEQVGRQTQYAIDDPNLQNIYRSSMVMQGSQTMQYPPPVPPERQLSSTGSSAPQYIQGARQVAGDMTGLIPQQQYASRGNVEGPYNVSLGPEPYQQLPTRTLPPPNHQYGTGSVMSNQPTMNPQHGSQQARAASGNQQNYDTRYNSNPYQGNPSYR